MNVLSAVYITIRACAVYYGSLTRNIAVLDTSLCVLLPTGYSKGLCYIAVSTPLDQLGNGHKSMVITVSPLIADEELSHCSLVRGLVVGCIIQDSIAVH